MISPGRFAYTTGNAIMVLLETRYVVPLQGSPVDRYRHFHVSDKGKVLEFAIQYKAQIDGVWHEIVRYDMAHGRPHKDLLHADSTEAKEEFLYYDADQVLTLGQDDIRKNWAAYREQYEKEMRRRR